ncbi:hypothetical protein MRB53_027601 [Persea americana]|uniref:Uncharacterized protein n=1 Tax=Persea americana TaxID=3435 RepID=A0ACC2LLV1_PERAE|nr:hypothetical protein MRB53_027601 [Persea americana]
MGHKTKGSLSFAPNKRQKATGSFALSLVLFHRYWKGKGSGEQGAHLSWVAREERGKGRGKEEDGGFRRAAIPAACCNSGSRSRRMGLRPPGTLPSLLLPPSLPMSFFILF